MRKNKNLDNNTTNFWISYADLMSGLLFVFILLIGAIIIKYSFLEKKSELLKNNLSSETSALNEAKKIIIEKNKKISLNIIALDKNEKKLFLSNNTLVAKIQELDDINISLKKINIKNTSLSKENKDHKIIIENKERNIKKLIEENINNKNTIKLSKTKTNILLQSLDTAYIIIDDNKKDLNKLLNEILEKKIEINDYGKLNKELDEQLVLMKLRSEKNKENFNKISKDLSITKLKIKNFTGLKIKVIKLLKESLGKDIKLDQKSGKIILSSKILFEEGESELKKDSIKDLKKVLNSYLNAILQNDEINKHIDKIIIEGHTNSKGSFLFNLNLSQKRAYAVMKFIFEQDFENKHKLKHLLISSGRSFLDPVYNNGIEDKNASRRIEIKFSLKNEDAIKEIEKILNK